MVNQPKDADLPPAGTIVSFPWGLSELRGTIVEIYGPAGRPQALIELTPELSGDIVDEPTTVSFPLDVITVVPAVA